MITAADKDRQQRIALLEERATIREAQLKRNDISPTDIQDYKNTLQQLAKLRRIERCRWDLYEFGYEYFSEDKCSNSEHVLLFNSSPSPPFHRELCSLVMEIKETEGAAHMAVSAPRSHSKSTWANQLNLLHSIAYGLTNFTVVISAARKQAVDFMKYVGSVLKSNEKFRADFGELMSPITQRNEMDREDSMVLANGIRIDSYGFLSPLRGLRHMSHRPDVICDDVEGTSNISTKEAIQKTLEYFDGVVMPLGSPQSSKVYVIGTILAKNSLLDTLLRRGSWKTRIWRAVIQDSAYPELWNEYRSILLDKRFTDSHERATQFYAEHPEMEEGVNVLWPERMPYKKLMDIKYEAGIKTFLAEYQSNPTDPTNAVFNIDELYFYDNYDDEYIYDHDVRIPLSECEIVGSIDLARGKQHGDYTAITILARSKTGAIYILLSRAVKAGQLDSIQECIKIIEKYKPRKFVVESIGYSGEFSVLLKTELQRLGVYHTTVEELRTRGRKEERIESLQPYCENGTLRFHRSQFQLMEEMNDFRPTGSMGHDDSVDSLQMAVSQLVGASNISVLEYYRYLQERDTNGGVNG